jgi:hypothetical protein
VAESAFLVRSPRGKNGRGKTRDEMLQEEAMSGAKLQNGFTVFLPVQIVHRNSFATDTTEVAIVNEVKGTSSSNTFDHRFELPQLPLTTWDIIYDRYINNRLLLTILITIVPLHKCTNHMQIHPKPHNDAMKQWVHLTHLLFSRTQGRLGGMYLHLICTFMQRSY